MNPTEPVSDSLARYLRALGRQIETLSSRLTAIEHRTTDRSAEPFSDRRVSPKLEPPLSDSLERSATSVPSSQAHKTPSATPTTPTRSQGETPEPGRSTRPCRPTLAPRTTPMTKPTAERLVDLPKPIEKKLERGEEGKEQLEETDQVQRQEEGRPSDRSAASGLLQLPIDTAVGPLVPSKGTPQTACDTTQKQPEPLTQVVQQTVAAVSTTDPPMEPTPERLLCTLSVPDAVVGHLIGRDGRGLKLTTDISAAYITVAKAPKGSTAPRLVSIRGTSEEIGKAVVVIGKRIAQHRVPNPRKKPKSPSDRLLARTTKPPAPTATKPSAVDYAQGMMIARAAYDIAFAPSQHLRPPTPPQKQADVPGAWDGQSAFVRQTTVLPHPSRSDTYEADKPEEYHPYVPPPRAPGTATHAETRARRERWDAEAKVALALEVNAINARPAKREPLPSSEAPTAVSSDFKVTLRTVAEAKSAGKQVQPASDLPSVPASDPQSTPTTGSSTAPMKIPSTLGPTYPTAVSTTLTSLRAEAPRKATGQQVGGRPNIQPTTLGTSQSQVATTARPSRPTAGAFREATSQQQVEGRPSDRLATLGTPQSQVATAVRPSPLATNTPAVTPRAFGRAHQAGAPTSTTRPQADTPRVGTDRRQTEERPSDRSATLGLPQSLVDTAVGPPPPTAGTPRRAKHTPKTHRVFYAPGRSIAFPLDSLEEANRLLEGYPYQPALTRARLDLARRLLESSDEDSGMQVGQWLRSKGFGVGLSA